MKDFECIILIVIILIIIFFIFNYGDNGDNCIKENFDASSYVFKEGYNSKDNLMDCNIKEYENNNGYYFGGAGAPGMVYIFAQ